MKRAGSVGDKPSAVLMSLQASIDRDLGGGKRKLLLEGKFSKVVEHGTARRTVAYSLYLFSDALLVTRPAMFSKKEWFKQYYPLQSLVVWDVPDQAGALQRAQGAVARDGCAAAWDSALMRRQHP